MSFRKHLFAKATLLLILPLFCGNLFAQETVQYQEVEYPPWYVGFNLGRVVFEGDEALQNGTFGSLRLGYDYSDRWSFEAGLTLAPNLKKNWIYDYDTGSPVEREGLVDAKKANMFALDFDVLLHLFVVENRHWDPYFLAGVQARYFSKDRANRHKFDPTIRFGMGLAYHFNPVWAVRAEFIGAMTLEKQEFNLMPAIGVTWKWGAKVPKKYVAYGGALDSDGDGLPDDFERKIGTDPFNPDTDGDGLTDWEEFVVYFTDPCRADTDYDGLTDGEEILAYKTDPHNRDTDGGGVADGHEVIEDQTDPLDPSDDLLLITLNIEFDTDKDIIHAEYFEKLDALAKTILRDPNSTVRIEGHADQRKSSKHDYNLSLSERRAKSVLEYLSRQGIEKSRMTPVGYGFTRPVTENHPSQGNRQNRRVEVYIRESSK
ncbi:MAG: OmpA family protein [Lentisphaerae bacterium]|nr:OmpA family protein [Lentisphaerota bacterium]